MTPVNALRDEQVVDDPNVLVRKNIYPPAIVEQVSGILISEAGWRVGRNAQPKTQPDMAGAFAHDSGESTSS
jgi:hypothetical protein